MKFTVVEIFRSVQGEGLDVGRECIFIRFSGCNRNCIWCFTENTEIATPNGVRKIKDIKIGDKVFSYDGKNIVEDEVTNTFKRKADREEMLRITHERPNGTKSILKTYVTENHRFYVKGEWVEAKDLMIGDEIYSFDYLRWKMVNNNPIRVENELIFHNGVKVLGIERLSERQMARWGNKDTVDVYNFETKNHNYIANSMLVHNCDTDWSKGEVKTLQELLKEIDELNCSYVVLTGGEPMLQEGIKALTTALFSKGYEIAIETNGTVYKEDLFVDLMAISPKLSSSGREFNEYDELISLIHDYPSFLKFVISDEKDMKEAKRIIETLYNIDLLPEIVFQPEFESGDFNALPKMAEKVLGELYNEVYIRFLPQIHKLVGVR